MRLTILAGPIAPAVGILILRNFLTKTVTGILPSLHTGNMNYWKKEPGVDMSTMPEYRPPMDSQHRMYVRNTLIGCICSAVVILGLVVMGVLMTKYGDQTSQNQQQVYKAEYQKAVQACEHAAPATVGVCVANVNANFKTGP